MRRSPHRTSALSLTLAILVFFTAASSSAIGIFLPRQPDVASPVLQSVSADAVIEKNIARTRITQIFRNPNPRAVEADFYFPVPPGADITDFVLYMNGKPVKGEILGKDEAHNTYRDIVRRMKDPGLVEWADKNLFRVRVFPIPANGDQKLEIELTQALTSDQGYFRYTLTNDSQKHPAGPIPTIRYTVRLEDDAPVRNVYSPTHKIDTNSSNPKSILVTADDNGQARDFSLFYESSQKDVALSLLAHRTAGSDGYFALRISPPWQEQTTSSQPGDYVFVVDTSGSMSQGDKIDQARKALRYCVQLLNPADRMALVRFSTGVEKFRPELVAADETNRRAALSWVDGLRPQGGTNISEAIKTGLQLRDPQSSASGNRLFTVVFLTDGLPTVGQTSPEAITNAAMDQSGGNVRIFTFGVGNDVNTRLLDALAEKTRAASDYVAPGSDLEVPVSRFFDKVSRPALFNLELSIPGAQVSEVYPGQLPDLFYGSELAVFGRYKTAGPSAITLSGTMNGEKKTYTFEKTFPESTTENAFLEKLWSTRKVAWLLDQVRQNGESAELRKEIEDLARKYSIVTPYTSFLAMEDEPVTPLPAEDSALRGRPPVPRHPMPMLEGGVAGKASQSVPAAMPAYSRSSASADYSAASGERAVAAAQTIRTMKTTDRAEEKTPVNNRVIRGKTFHKTGDAWKDQALDSNTPDKTVEIKYLSEAWFHLSENFPELRDFFALGNQVQILLANGTQLSISDEGIENIDVIPYVDLGLTVPQKK